MKCIDTFLGKPIKYWFELQRNAEKLYVVDYIAEIAELRAKVNFYEDRIEQINKFKEHLSQSKS